MKRTYGLVHLAFVGLVATLLAGCGGSGMSGSPQTAEQVKRETLERVQSATTVLAQRSARVPIRRPVVPCPYHVRRNGLRRQSDVRRLAGRPRARVRGSSA